MKRKIQPRHAGVSQEEVQPWHRLGGVEHICELRKSSQVIYSIFVTILRMMYSSKEGRTFGCPDVIWRKDPQKTELWIDTELRWEDTRPDFTPAIFVCLGEMKYELPPGMGMQGMSVITPGAEINYERNVTGTASIMHVCDKAGAACCLADNTDNYLSFLQDQIKEEYCFDHFIVAGRVPRQMKELPQTAGKGKYVSVVQVQYDFTDAWMVKMETPILKSVALMEEDFNGKNIAGTVVDVSGGTAEIEFGDISTETDTPLDN